MTDGAGFRLKVWPACRTPFAPSPVQPRSFSMRWESETGSSRPGRLCLTRTLLHLVVEELDHRFVRIEGSMQAALLDVLQALGYFSVDCPTLLRSALIICRWQLRDDMNDTSRNLELQLIAGLKTCAPANASPDD